MGNEASQEGGVPGQQQAPGPPGMGPGPPRPAMVQPPPQQQQVRPAMGGMGFGGSLIGAVTRGPRPTTAVRPAAITQYPAGPDSVPRGQRPLGAGPIQVGVQPWADPPVQQPPFRGASPAFRGAAPQQHQQQTRPAIQQQQQQTRTQQIAQKQQQQQLLQQQQKQASEELGVDLSELSMEERNKILSVMAKAHDMEEDLQRHKRAKDPETAIVESRTQLLCPACRAVDLAVEVNKMCGDCGKNFCQKCGTFVPGEGRRSVWVCNNCSVARKEHSAAMATTQHQQESNSGNVTYTMADNKMVDLGRRDDPMSRVGQTFQQPQPIPLQQGNMMTSGIIGYGPANAMPGHTMNHQSTSLIGGSSVTSSSSGMVSGSLLSGASNKSGSLVGAIPRTVPLSSLSQSLQQQQDPMQAIWTQNQQQIQPTPQIQTTQWNFQQGQQQQQLMMAQTNLQSSPVLKPKGIELASGNLMQQPQKLKGQRVKQDQQRATDWSPGADLSPIMDVSPSLEAAGQEMMEKCQDDPNRPSIPRATSGTISGMLADFNRALGLATTPVDEHRITATTTTTTMMGTTGHHHRVNANVLGMSHVNTTTSVAPTTTGIIITDVDQNQNMVQQQYQLQQQQMMIQQQQQMIQQQQQQLQQQAHMQQQIQVQQVPGQPPQQQMPGQTQQQMLQMQQQQPLQQQMQPLQIQQSQQHMQMQQQLQPQQQQLVQPGGVIGSATQVQQARKVHGRLPQPTTEQMQAAVAIAAQTPRSKPRPLGGPTQRPVSPMMPRKTTPSDPTSLSQGRYLQTSDSTGLLGVGLTQTTSLSATPVSPSMHLRIDSDSASEPDSGKAGKIRRRLPPVPLDQEPTSIPRRSKDRTRTLSMGATPLGGSERAWDRKTPHRTTSLDGGMSLTTALGALTSSTGIDYSSILGTSTDSYLKYLTTSSAQLAGSSAIDTAAILSGISSHGIGDFSTSATSMLGRRDLSAPHSLSSYLRTSGVIPNSSLTPSYLLDYPFTSSADILSTSLDSALGGTKLPSYMMSLKQQLREGLRSVSDDRRRITDPDLSGLLSHSPWTGPTQDPYDPLRKGPSSSGVPLSSAHRDLTTGTTAQTSSRRNRHRRHASDTGLSAFSSLAREDFMEEPLSRYRFPQYSTATMPFKSFEFESIDDHLRTGGLLGGSYRPPLEGSLLRGSSAYPRRHTLKDDIGDLRLSQMASPKIQEQLRKYNRQMARMRRHTDTGLTGLTSLSSLGLGLDPYGRSNLGFSAYGGGTRRRRAERMVRKPRSWHPSPYVSEDEEGEDQREERKARIKAEIARRRQHIEERVHDELYKFARVRDPADAGYGMYNAGGGDRLYTSPISLESGSSQRSQGSELRGDGSVLHPIDDLFRKDIYGYRHHSSGYNTANYAPMDRHSGAAHRTSRYNRNYYDPYYDKMDDPSGWRAYGDELDPYDGGLDYSPMEPETPTDPTPPMPLLPDMPTRSRKILEELGSSPLVTTSSTTPRHRSSRTAQPYDDYVDHRHDDRSHRHRPQSHHDQAHDHQHSGERGIQATSRNRSRKPQNSKASQKYDFPVKRILLTRDPKDRSVSGNGLGMKVVGGKEIPGSHGMIGAYVARIYPGGVVETLGEVREGDQVLEWNGVALTGKTYEEVQRIIASSGDEVEIVIRSDFNMLSAWSSTQHHHSNDRHHQNRQHQSSSRLREGHMEGGNNRDQSGSRSTYQHHGGHGDSYQSRRSERYNRNYDSADYLQSPVDDEHNSNYYSYREYERNGYSPPTRGDHHGESKAPHPAKRSPTGSKGDYSESNKEKYRAEDISGEIQLQVCYDSKAAILYVTIVRARNLVTSRDNSGLPDPFVKCYLLPDRCVENERRTRYFSRCSDPEWKQTMVYPNVPQDQLKKRYLEISVWNYDINRPSEFLGEVIQDLKDPSVIDEQSRWYKLHPHDPKKYPIGTSSQVPALSNDGSTKMARLNNPAQKALYFDGEDTRKQEHTA